MTTCNFVMGLGYRLGTERTDPVGLILFLFPPTLVLLGSQSIFSKLWVLRAPSETELMRSHLLLIPQPLPPSSQP